jgi:hypothetical protein
MTNQEDQEKTPTTTTLKIVPLVGLPDIDAAVSLALQIEPTQGGLPADVLAAEHIRAQVWAQAKVEPLLASLIAMFKAHPQLAGLAPGRRASILVNPKLDTARALRNLLREEIMWRVEQLVRGELARRAQDSSEVM